jgi:hypothetical protein
MTLITTIVSNYGLIQASDSNITRSDSAEPRSGPKVFHLGFTDAALALAGTYEVGSQGMDTWMPSCISDYAATSQPSLEGFAHYLSDRLEEELNDRQRAGVTLIHIVGYVSHEVGAHPEFYFVRNAGAINRQTGAYDDIGGTFQVDEHFWTRDHNRPDARAAFDAGGYWSYFNGMPDGRIAFAQFGQIFGAFLQTVWNHPSWKFRPPQSLDELASLVALQIRTVGTLYGMSDYRAPFIGGEPQIERITPPDGALPL